MNPRHRLSPLYAACAALALLALAGPARADDPVRGSAVCTDSEAANNPPGMNPSFVACLAQYIGTDAPQTTLTQPFQGYGNFDFVGQTRADGTNINSPFNAFGSAFIFGELKLNSAQTGPFVIALASFGDYSFYLYDPSTAGGIPVSSIDISTYGTTNWTGGPYPLQYANLYTLAVPEPESYALMLAGLAATGLLLRRRRQQS